MIRLIGLFLVLAMVSACGQVRMGAAGAEQSSPALRVEERGVWLSKNQMLQSRAEVEALLDRFADANLTSVYINTQLRGFIMYPDSAILPQWREMAEHDRDIFDWLIPAIHARGMRAEAWMEYGFYSYWTPDATADASMGPVLDKRPDLLAVDAEGGRYLHNPNWGDFYSLCPAHPDAQELMIDLMDEVLRMYPSLDGVNLDRIRFAADNQCFCAHCRATFLADTGMELAMYPADSEGARAFDQWRKDQLHAFMGRLSSRIRSAHPGRSITAAVLPPYMKDDKGQGWTTWVEAGYLDMAMPMMYLPDVTGEVAWVRERLGDDAMIGYGLDAGEGQETLLRQMKQLRELNAHGIVFWYSGSVDPMLEAIRESVYTEPAVSPLGAPRSHLK